MENLRDLYAACGGDIDNEFVTIPEEMGPIDIVVRVVPTEIEFLYDPVVTLRVLLPSILGGVNDSGGITVFDQEVSFELPLKAIELAGETRT